VKPPSDPHDAARFGELKQKALEEALGPMYNLVGHAILAFEAGGSVDMYYFPDVLPGTAFVTQELISLDGTSPKPSRLGTYELIAFTRHPIPPHQAGEPMPEGPFNDIERRFCGIFTTLGRYAEEAVINPLETGEVPRGKGRDNAYLVLDEFKPPRRQFVIHGRRHGLLLCIEIHRTEMDFARANGVPSLLTRLKRAGHYPYSDLDRAAVA
jgi:hypothetical protein